ncbi:Uncharacterised protein [Serratia plymuthica]|nr:Uncharacterised protein [Serratia plymuthica]
MRNLFFVLVLIWADHALAVSFPVVTSIKITSCQDDPRDGPCSWYRYFAGTSAVVDIGDHPVPPPPLHTGLMGFMPRCDPAPVGVRPTNCFWNANGFTGPLLQNCMLTAGSQGGDWSVTRTSTCTLVSTWYGSTGSSTGWGCLAFGVMEAYGSNSLLYTPWGVVDATEAAGGKTSACVLPQPPAVSCAVSLPPVIDHLSLSPGTTDHKYIEGVVNCGTSPVITVLGSSEVTLAPGVVSALSTQMVGSTTVQVHSDLTVGMGVTPGQYSSSVVIAVSPN